MANKNIYTIRYVSQRTGLTPHVIRAWEKRYQAVVPERSPKNRRLYSEDDVHHLKLLKKMTEAGHNISQVAGLDLKELSELAQHDAAVSPGLGVSSRNLTPQVSASDYRQECLSAVLKLDPDALEHQLDQAAVDLTRAALLNDVIVPLFKEIGKLWHGGSLKIINEHMATTVTRNFLMNLLRTAEINASAPKIVVATPVGQWHDLGALSVALAAAENGWHPVYFGPNLPAEEIAAGVKQSGSSVVAISITHLLNQHPFIIELRKLRRYIGKNVTLFVGGRVPASQMQVVVEVNAIYIQDIEYFRQELNSLMDADLAQK